MEQLKDKLFELVPATSAYAVTGTGVLMLSDLINAVLLVLLVVQLAYVSWKWQRDWKRHNKTKRRKRVEQRCEVYVDKQY